jgi:hypothetical protein
MVNILTATILTLVFLYLSEKVAMYIAKKLKQNKEK